MTSYVRAPLNFAAHQRATVGDQKISFTSFDHLGWMKCDGRAVSRTTYALLFEVIGTTFGTGDGSTTFNLPNFSGCVPGIAGQPSFNQTVNNTIYARGDKAGEQRHQLTVPEMPTHNHGDLNGATISGGNHTHNYLGVSGQSAASGGDNVAENDPRPVETTTGTGAHSHTLTAAGGNLYHNNMQPTLFSGNMYIFSGRMYSGLGTYPYSAATDLA